MTIMVCSNLNGYQKHFINDFVYHYFVQIHQYHYHQLLKLLYHLLIHPISVTLKEIFSDFKNF